MPSVTKAKMNYRIEYGGTELLDLIEPLWQELTLLHSKKSQYFKEDYKAFQFETRKRDLIEKSKRGSLKVFLCLDDQNRICGYSISSLQDYEGEIDSIYIKEKSRRKGIGSDLMSECIKWFKENSVKRIKVGVAFGNEEVFPFYEKFGFFPRVTFMTSKHWLSG